MRPVAVCFCLAALALACIALAASLAEGQTPAQRAAALSASEVAAIGAAADLAAQGNVAAQAWLDARLAAIGGK